MTRRWVVTAQRPGEMRCLAQAMQGRYTYATREEAQAELDVVVANNSPRLLREIGWVGLEVRECECYPGHFDPVGCWFD